jgi:hypothetical protein
MAALLELCQITSQSIFAFICISIYWYSACIFTYFIYFTFNFVLMPDFIIFGKINFFFANNFLTKSDLTSTLCRLLQVYYSYTSQVIKKLLQRDDSRFFSHGVSWATRALQAHLVFLGIKLQETAGT